MTTATLKQREQSQDIDVIDLDGLSVEEVVALLKGLLAEIYRKIGHASLLILNLEKRGHDMAEFNRIPVFKHVRNVAIGILSKEAFAAYYGRMDILRCMAALPLQEQITIVECGSVPVVDTASGAKSTHRLIKVVELTPQEVALAFDVVNHKVRTPEEQAKHLHATRIKEKMRRSKFVYDERSNILECSATPAEITAYIRKNGLA